MFSQSIVITKHRLLWTFALAPLLWLILVFYSGSFFSFPQTDDFCTFGRLFKVNADNPFIDTWYMYQNWSGRYSSMFIVALTGWLSSVVPLSMNITYYLMIGTLLLAFLAGCVMSFHALLMDKCLSISCGLVAFAVSVVFMPSKLEGVFWLTGAAVYVSGIACFMFLLWSISKDDRNRSSALMAVYPWLSLMLIVVGIGFNELLAVSVGEFIFLRIMLSNDAKLFSRQNVLYVAIYLGSFIFSILAPGNFLRDKTSMVPRHQVLQTLHLTELSFEHLVHGYIVPNISILALLFFGIFVTAYTLRPIKVLSFRYLLPSLLTLISALPVHIFIYSFLTGEEAPGRVINQCYVMLLIGLCLLSAWIGARVSFGRHGFGNMRLARIVVFVVGVALISSAQFRQIVETIRTFGPIWRQQQIERMVLLEAGNGKAVSLDPFLKAAGPTPILEGSDISGDPSYWVNKCVSNLYGTRSVRLREP